MKTQLTIKDKYAIAAITPEGQPSVYAVVIEHEGLLWTPYSRTQGLPALPTEADAQALVTALESLEKLGQGVGAELSMWMVPWSKAKEWGFGAVPEGFKCEWETLWSTPTVKSPPRPQVDPRDDPFPSLKDLGEFKKDSRAISGVGVEMTNPFKL